MDHGGIVVVIILFIAFCSLNDKQKNDDKQPPEEVFMPYSLIWLDEENLSYFKPAVPSVEPVEHTILCYPISKERFFRTHMFDIYIYGNDFELFEGNDEKEVSANLNSKTLWEPMKGTQTFLRSSKNCIGISTRTEYYVGLDLHDSIAAMLTVSIIGIAVISYVVLRSLSFLSVLLIPFRIIIMILSFAFMHPILTFIPVLFLFLYAYMNIPNF